MPQMLLLTDTHQKVIQLVAFTHHRDLQATRQILLLGQVIIAQREVVNMISRLREHQVILLTHHQEPVDIIQVEAANMMSLLLELAVTLHIPLQGVADIAQLGAVNTM